MNDAINNAVKDIISYSAKELEYLAENVNELTTWYIMDRIIDLQGVLNVALNQIHKSSQRSKQ